MTKAETKSTVLLKHHRKALKLPTMTAECEAVAARCAKENVDHLGFLLQLCERELLEREGRAAQRRLKAARFPTVKTLEGFDFAAAPKLNKPLCTGSGLRPCGRRHGPVRPTAVPLLTIVADPADLDSIVLNLDGRRQIAVAPGFDPETLQGLIEPIKARP